MAKWTVEAEWTKGYDPVMANPKVIRLCLQCGINREHYTRRGGRTISPCCECQILKAKKRQDDIRDDPGALDRQRVEWNRIKKRQRLIYRGEVGVVAGEPAIQPASIPMVERKRARRRRREALGKAVSLVEDAPPQTGAPRRRRRRRQTPIDAGLD